MKFILDFSFIFLNDMRYLSSKSKQNKIESLEKYCFSWLTLIWFPSNKIVEQYRSADQSEG